MPSPKPSRQPAAASDAVDALLAALVHPNKAGIELFRQIILGVDPRIREAVKWNAPSFMLDDHFATFKLHPPGNLQLVLHTGAKPRKPPRQFVLQGAEHLVKWAAPDRCVVNLGGAGSAQEHSQHLSSLVQQWIRQL